MNRPGEQRRSYLLFAAFVALLLVASCKVGPNYQAPEMELRESFRFDSITVDSFINIAWWEQFQDDGLQQLIRTALDENKNYLQAIARVEEARAFYGFVKADLYPRFDLQAGYTRSNLNPASSEQTSSAFNQFFIAPVMNWEIDFWGKFRRANEAAMAELLSSEYARRQVAITLISEIASTYFTLLDFENRLQIALQTLNARKESTRIIQERFNKGVVAEIDLNQAQIQEAIAEASIPLYQRNIAFLQHRLRILTGNMPGTVTTTETLMQKSVPPEIPVGMPSVLLKRRPDILQAEEALIAQNARIGVAVAQRFPAISISGLVGAASTDFSSLFTGDGLVWSISGNLLSPLFYFGKNKRRVQVERYRTEQALYAYEQKVLESFAEVQDAMISIYTYGQEVEARSKQVDAATKANDLSRERYDGGVTSYLEVLEQDRTLFSARLELSLARREELNAHVALYKALGGGWLSPEEQQEQETPEE